MDDWDLARDVLQVIAEETHGRMVRKQLGSEDAEYEAAKRALGG